MATTIALLVLVIVWTITWFLNKRYDDDQIKDFLRYVLATFLSMGIVFFWHWI